MHRRRFLETGIGVATASITGCTSESADPRFEEGFEDGIGDWEGDATVESEVDSDEFNWEVEVSDAEASSGEHSLRIWNEGDFDDGVTWGLHPVSIESGHAYEIDVTAQFWSESESFNRLRDAVMRLAPEPPEVETDFPDPGVNSTNFGETDYGGLREPLWLSEGWREYSFGWTTPELTTDTLFLAVGTSVVWESDLAHYVDEIIVEIEKK